ncbi:Oxygen-dependent choline dehydrogenase [Orchesella cincta]|uniref:Oxygen-dependent choline dehydrogenase n=1 Tax=Orchesella cincta TaxID=48709 RepID=A0A1D2NB74_ORCCI|nr:Oxygen-dependent choline dehydrogenase [Orchesella cincta]
MRGGQELGYQIKDPNGPQQVSFGPIEFSRRFGRRATSFTEYIRPILNSRRNLRIVTNARVSKVIFEGNRAVGVQYTISGRRSPSRVRARKEVILSAGTYGSSTLLMRSGIGPRGLLRKAGIPLLKELPVGENFQEHPVVPLQFIINNKSLALDRQRDLTPENYQLYLRRGIGPFSSVAGYSGQAFLASSVATNEGYPGWPDIQLALSAVNAPMEPFKNVRLGPTETPILVFLYLAREKSRGTVKLDTSNVNGMPLIDFNYLEDPRDEQVLLEAIRFTMNFLENTTAFKSVGARYLRNPLPACSKFRFRSEEYWSCYMRQTIIQGNHPSSTCSMNTVVDSSLRVIGMKGLRVVDGSVMPVITNTNLQAAIYGIAEKISEDILRVWR